MQSDMNDWRKRLRQAIDRSGKTHAAIAKAAGVTPCTLSMILSGKHVDPRFGTIVRITHAALENVGWILGEPRTPLTVEGQARMRGIINFRDEHFPELDPDSP
jgi:transcriptional regulator with XRE-family HTH domain